MLKKSGKYVKLQIRLQPNCKKVSLNILVFPKKGILYIPRSLSPHIMAMDIHFSTFYTKYTYIFSIPYMLTKTIIKTIKIFRKRI